jgi:hypothetical protein
MLKFQYVSFLEVNGRACHNDFVNECIQFCATRDAKLLFAPFLENLKLYDGCRIGTMGVLWKYYCSVIQHLLIVALKNKRQEVKENDRQVPATPSLLSCAFLFSFLFSGPPPIAGILPGIYFVPAKRNPPQPNFKEFMAVCPWFFFKS